MFAYSVGSGGENVFTVRYKWKGRFNGGLAHDPSDS